MERDVGPWKMYAFDPMSHKERTYFKISSMMYFISSLIFSSPLTVYLISQILILVAQTLASTLVLVFIPMTGLSATVLSDSKGNTVKVGLCLLLDHKKAKRLLPPHELLLCWC